MDLGLGMKLIVAKLEPAFLTVTGARHVLGHLGTLEVQKLLLLQAADLCIRWTPLTAIAGFPSSLLLRISSHWVLGFQVLTGCVPSNSCFEILTPSTSHCDDIWREGL